MMWTNTATDKGEGSWMESNNEQLRTTFAAALEALLNLAQQIKEWMQDLVAEMWPKIKQFVVDAARLYEIEEERESMLQEYKEHKRLQDHAYKVRMNTQRKRALGWDRHWMAWKAQRR